MVSKRITLILCAVLLISLSIIFIVSKKQETPQKPTPEVAPAQKLVLYSARKEHLIRPLLEQYRQQHGVDIQLMTGKAGALIERISHEAPDARPDMLLTVDIGNLSQAAERGLFTPIQSQALQIIPAHLRDDQNRWFGLTKRVRTIAYSTTTISPEQLSTYEDLSEGRWKDQLCLRTSKKVYNQSLVASMIAALGKPRTQQVIQGWVNNLAADVFSSDTKALKAIAAGRCALTVVNSYYFFRLKATQPQIPIQLFWPNQNGRGVHVNISGAGILATSKNKVQATHFLEWLVSPEAQKQLAELNHEYPVRPGVASSQLVSAAGTFKEDLRSLSEISQYQHDAIRLMTEVGYQ